MKYESYHDRCAAGTSDYEKQVRAILTEVGDVLIERAKQYGDPHVNFKRIADAWSLELGTTITPAQVVRLMLALKQVRHLHKADRDSAIDIMGYTVCGLLINAN